MADTIIGREAEQEILRQRIESDIPKLITIYGRRRIGKTFLVRQYFNDKFSFYCTGIRSTICLSNNQHQKFFLKK